MSERPGDDLRVHIEASSADVAALAGYRPFAAGRVIAGVTTGRRHENDVVLVRGAHSVDSELKAKASECVVLPADVEPALAILAPPLASALALWETLRLELGDAAVWTTGGSLSALVGQVALWRGACPGVALGAASDRSELTANGIERIDSSDQELAAGALAEVSARRPGFAAIDLSGRADLIDILLEAIPRWGRLLLAGPAGAPVTIDFYKNVHRKGIILASTTIEPGVIFDSEPGLNVRSQIGHAVAILRNSGMAQHCQQLLGAALSTRPVSLAG